MPCLGGVDSLMHLSSLGFLPSFQYWCIIIVVVSERSFLCFVSRCIFGDSKCFVLFGMMVVGVFPRGDDMFVGVMDGPVVGMSFCYLWRTLKILSRRMGHCTAMVTPLYWIVVFWCFEFCGFIFIFISLVVSILFGLLCFHSGRGFVFDNVPFFVDYTRECTKGCVCCFTSLFL